MDDKELEELFSAFDDVSATESLKSSTLNFVMAAVAPAASAVEGVAEAAAGAPGAEAPAGTSGAGASAGTPEGASTAAATEAPVAQAIRGKRAHSKWRAISMGAVAACL